MSKIYGIKKLGTKNEQVSFGTKEWRTIMSFNYS